MENNLTVPQTTKNKDTMWPSNSNSWEMYTYIYIYIYPHKHLYINAYSIIIHNNQTVETIQMSINGWILNNQNLKNTNNGGQAVRFVTQIAFLLNLMQIALLLPIFATTKQSVSPRAWGKRWWSHYRFTKLIFQNCRKSSFLFWIVFLEP